MADDVLIRLLLDAAQFLQEGGKAEDAVDKLSEAVDRAVESGSSAEEVMASFDAALLQVGASSGVAADGVDRVSESADRARRRLKTLNDQIRSGSGSATSQLDKIGVGLRKVGKGLGAVAAAAGTFFASFRGTRRVIEGLKTIGIDVDGLVKRFLNLVKAGEAVDTVLSKIAGREHLEGTEDLAASIRILNERGVEFENTAEGIRAAIRGLTEEQRTLNERVANSDEAFSGLVASVSGFTADEFVAEMNSIVGAMEAARRRGDDLINGPLGPVFQDRLGKASEALRLFGDDLRADSENVEAFDEAAKAFGNAAKQIDQLSAVEEHHAQILEQEAEAAKVLKEEIEELSEKAEALKALQAELIKLGDEAVAQAGRAKEALEEAFGDPEQKETQAFADRERQLDDLKRKLEEVKEAGSEAFLADPAALEQERQLIDEIRVLEGQRVAQFEEVAQSAEDASRRQADAQQAVTDVVEGSRAAVQGLSERFPQLDESSKRVLEGIISNFELELTVTENAAAATDDFAQRFQSALGDAQTKAETAFGLMEKGAESAADAQERLKDETEGVGEQTERAAEAAGVLNIALGESITKYGGLRTEGDQFKSVSEDVREIWTDIRNLI